MLWLESLDDLLAQAAVVPKPEPAESPANQDTPARPPKELRKLHRKGDELA
jgi:hypothetical protein